MDCSPLRSFSGSLFSLEKHSGKQDSLYLPFRFKSGIKASFIRPVHIEKSTVERIGAQDKELPEITTEEELQ